MVCSLKYLKSFGRCHGIWFLRPMALFSEAATIIVNLVLLIFDVLNGDGCFDMWVIRVIYELKIRIGKGKYIFDFRIDPHGGQCFGRPR